MTWELTAAKDTEAHPSDLRVVPSDGWRISRLITLIPGVVVGLSMIWTSTYVFNGRRYFTLFDDAMISMTYARTFARTGELVWYPGADRVEGITNPLYTMIMVIPHLLGLNGSTACLFMALFGLATVLAAAFLSGGIAARLCDRRSVAVATTLTVSLSFPLLFWSVFGLEVGLITLLTLALVTLSMRSQAAGYALRSLIAVAAVSAVGVAVRPDFTVAAGVTAVWLLVGTPSNALTSRPTRALVLIGSLAVTLSAITAARYLYYGALTPNTYDLKMGSSALLVRLSRAISVETVAVTVMVLGVVGLLLLRRNTRDTHRLLILLCSLAVAQTIYTYYTGGDVFDPDRFVVPATTLMTIVILAGVGRLANGHFPRWTTWLVASGCLGVVLLTAVNQVPRWTAVVPAVLVALVLAWTKPEKAESLVSIPNALPVPILPMICAGLAVLVVTWGNTVIGYRGWFISGATLDPLDRTSIVHSTEIAQMTDPKAVVAVLGAGNPPYWNGRPTIDLLGKSDRIIAQGPRRGPMFIPGHDKYNFIHSVVDLAPDLVDTDVPVREIAALPRDFNLFQANPTEIAAIKQRYELLCLPSGGPVLVRNDTQMVHRDLLSPCQPSVTGAN